MRASDLMTTEVVSVSAENTIKEAAALMLQHRVSALPVLDAQDRLIGILTEGDLIHRGELGTERRHGRLGRWFASPATLAQEYVQAHASLVGDAMTMALVTAKPDTSLADIADLMDKHGIRRIPIVDQERLVGIVARHDLVRVLAGRLPALLGGALSDGMILDVLLGEIGRQSWANKSDFDITVTDGTVTLSALLPSDAERKAVLLLARNIPGVKSVEDRITVVPISYPAVGS